jgi:hypothetical protein
VYFHTPPPLFWVWPHSCAPPYPSPLSSECDLTDLRGLQYPGVGGSWAWSTSGYWILLVGIHAIAMMSGAMFLSFVFFSGLLAGCWVSSLDSRYQHNYIVMAAGFPWVSQEIHGSLNLADWWFSSHRWWYDEHYLLFIPEFATSIYCLGEESNLKSFYNVSGVWWLIPTIPATWEA